MPIFLSCLGLDVAFVGVTLDCGASNRSGTRFGPRQIRTESVMLRAFNKETGAKPFHSLVVGDVGDVYFSMFDLPKACQQISDAYRKHLSTGCKTLTLGGDHTITYPILQAYKEKYGPVGLIHVDAHTDTSESMAGSSITHGTPFRRAVEEGLLDTKRVIQIGLRGTGYDLADLKWGMDQGFRYECTFYLTSICDFGGCDAGLEMKNVSR